MMIHTSTRNGPFRLILRWNPCSFQAHVVLDKTLAFLKIFAILVLGGDRDDRINYHTAIRRLNFCLWLDILDNSSGNQGGHISILTSNDLLCRLPQSFMQKLRIDHSGTNKRRIISLFASNARKK